MKYSRIIVALVLLIITALILGVFFIQQNSNQPHPKTSPIKIPFVKLERSDNPAKHERGLMFRTDLCPDCGMLFIFNNQAPRTFWMKNTPTSLDMVFIRSDGTIAEIHESTIPNSETQYASGPVQYVLEAPAGYAQRHNLNVNQKLDIQHLLSRSE